MWKIEKMPFILAILIALIGWSLTHIISRSLQDPIIEYSIKKEEYKNNKRNIIYEIENISRNKMFRYIEFIFQLNNSSDVIFLESECRIRACPPLETKEESVTEKNVFKILIKEFHPDCKFSVDLLISGETIPDLVFSTYRADPNLAYQKEPGDQAIRLVKASFETFLIKNETKIIVVFILLWILLAIFYILYFARYNKHKLSQSESNLKQNK